MIISQEQYPPKFWQENTSVVHDSDKSHIMIVRVNLELFILVDGNSIETKMRIFHKRDCQAYFEDWK